MVARWTRVAAAGVPRKRERLPRPEDEEKGEGASSSSSKKAKLKTNYDAFMKNANLETRFGAKDVAMSQGYSTDYDWKNRNRQGKGNNTNHVQETAAGS